MTLSSEIRIKLFSGKQVGQHPGIKLKQATKYFDCIVPKVGGSTSPEWWVNINRNGGSTWFGIYSERLGIPNLYDESNKTANSIQSIGEIRKAVKTHNLLTLLIFSGLKVKLDNDKANNKTLARSNSLLFSAWDESARYKPCGHFKPADVNNLITLLHNNDGILKWIERN